MILNWTTEYYFSLKQTLDRVKELKRLNKTRIKWYQVRNRYYVTFTD